MSPSRSKLPVLPVARLALLLVACVAISACRPEDPARVELRALIKQEARLSNESLGRLLDEVSRTIAGKTVRFTLDGATGELDAPQRGVVLGMLTERAGVFDQGLRTDGGAPLRIINAPGRSANSEYEATRLLLVDVETFIPRRFEFFHTVQDAGDYAFNLLIE